MYTFSIMYIHINIYEFEFSYFTMSFLASEVANNKKNNVSNSVPIKVRSFAKKMDDTSKNILYIMYCKCS